MRAAAPIIEAQLSAAVALQVREEWRRASSPAGEGGGGEIGAGPVSASSHEASGAAASSADEDLLQLSARARRRLRNAALKEQRRTAGRTQAQEARAEAEAAAGAALASAGARSPLGAPAASSTGVHAGLSPAAAAAAAAAEAAGAAEEPAAASNEWEVFFRAHPTAKFFRERRYLGLSFPCLAPAASGGGTTSSSGPAGRPAVSGAQACGTGPRHILELGAGCGSSILPLLKLHPR
jgi:hypothetical protein